MQREFVLRDGEIAINKPNGEVVIMNINTYADLENSLKEDTNKRDKVAFNLASKLLRTEYDKVVKDLEDKVAELQETLRIKNDSIACLMESEKKNVQTIQELTAKLEANKAKTKSVPDIIVRYVDAMAGPIFVPTRDCPRNNMVYVTHEGKVFANQTSVESYYKLPKNSVSAYCCGRQHTLITPDGKYIGIVCKAWSLLYDNERYITATLYENYESAITFAKKSRSYMQNR